MVGLTIYLLLLHAIPLTLKYKKPLVLFLQSVMHVWSMLIQTYVKKDIYYAKQFIINQERTVYLLNNVDGIKWSCTQKYTDK